MPARRGNARIADDGEKLIGHRRVSIPYDIEWRWYQGELAKYILNGGKRALPIWHRKAGKDVASLATGAMMTQMRVGPYWHCFPTYSQAMKAMWHGFRSDGKPVIESIFHKDVLARRPNDSDMILHLRNGSTYQFIGADNMDALVGANPFGIVFSEFAIMRKSVWDLARPMLRENGGWAIFPTTPRGKNHAWDMLELAKKDKRWFWSHLSIFDTGQGDQSTIDEEIAQGMDPGLARQEYLCDFTAANVGSVFGDLFEELEKRDGILDFLHPMDGVYTSWDLGHADSTAIWFWRLNGEGISVIDHYENRGKPISHYLDVLDERKYEYVRHWLPHDARAKTLASGSSVLEAFVGRWTAGKVGIVPNLSLADGIQAGRWLLQQKDTRFHKRCDEKDGISALREYHYCYDEDKKVFDRKPEHDWSSHTADAWRYTGVVVKMEKLASRREPEKKKKPIGPANMYWTLDELWDARKRDNAGGRI